jgi:hypothetical protein
MVTSVKTVRKCPSVYKVLLTVMEFGFVPMCNVFTLCSTNRYKSINVMRNVVLLTVFYLVRHVTFSLIRDL